METSTLGLMRRDGALIVVAYAVAIAAAAATVAGLDRDPIVELLVADVVATIVVFGFSVAFDNSSFYDAYWSVAPPLVAGTWWWQAGAPLEMRPLIVLGLVTLWAVRLTYNWARGWNGLGHEDWRYVDIRAKSGLAYWPASFAGIHLFPTLIVFAGCLPLEAAVGPARPLNLVDGAAAVVTGGAILIETIADQQLRRFCQDKATGAIMASGLWRYSRHPNYFGEAGFWWGLALFAVAAGPVAYWQFLGAAAISAMFVVVSIPLMEKRSMARRPAYAEHQRRVSMIVPWPPRR
jgi:steroid 5-alpha reductase family enzyme